MWQFIPAIGSILAEVLGKGAAGAAAKAGAAGNLGGVIAGLPGKGGQQPVNPKTAGSEMPLPSSSQQIPIRMGMAKAGLASAMGMDDLQQLQLQNLNHLGPQLNDIMAWVQAMNRMSGR